MLKNNRRRIILTSLIVLLPMVAGLLLWNRLPERMPTHFGPDGQADGWSGKAFAVFFMPLFLLAVHLFCLAVTSADPKHRNISDSVLGLVFWIAPLTSAAAGILTYTAALGQALDVNLFMQLVIGLLFVVIGNFLPKCRQNYTVGIKLPWTLHDPDNWNKTHRFAGRLWVVGGLVLMATAFFRSAGVMTAVLLALALAPVVYSFLLYRQRMGRTP